MDIHYAQYLANELYGIEMPEDKFEELALIAYNHIGNKICRTYRYFGKVDKDTLSLELPCNVLHIISVCGALEDWEHVTNKHWHGDPDSFAIEQYIEKTKMFRDPLYQSGKFLKYEQVGNTLYFDKPYPFVGILYRGQELDDNGLPEINDKEANAIAVYIAYTQKYKEALQTMDKNMIAAAQMLKRDWDIKCDQAKTPEFINHNQMDEILNAKTNWNRKQFNKSYKGFNS